MPWAAITSLTPASKRSATPIMWSNAASVSTSSSVARVAASESAFPASVPPMPPTSDVSSVRWWAMTRSATSSVIP